MKKILLLAIGVLLLSISAVAQPTCSSLAIISDNRASQGIRLICDDDNGQTLTYAVVTAPIKGTFTLNPNTGTGTYRPYTQQASGTTDSFTITATDTSLNTSAVATVTITFQNKKTRVRDRIPSYAGGKITFILTQKVASVDGLLPIDSSVTANIDSSGFYEVDLYPSSLLNPTAYWQVWVSPATNAPTRQVPLGIASIPATTAVITLTPYMVTDTNLQAQYLFASNVGIQSIITTLESVAGAVGANDANAVKNNVGADQATLGALDTNVPTKTEAQIAGIAAGRPGREFYQSNGIIGFYKDFGPAGIRRVSACINAYEIGIVPGTSTAAAANQAAYNAFHTAAPAGGACIQFSEGEFHFTGPLANTKPMQIHGVGANFSNQSTPVAGTSLLFDPGSAGITFTGAIAAKGGVVMDLNIRPRSAYTGTTGNGIYSNAIITVRNVAIEGFSNHGLFLDGTTGNVAFSQIDTVHSSYNRQDNFRIEGSDGNKANFINVNSTSAGRHGMVDAGSSNTWTNPHTSISGVVSGTATSHDYYITGGSGTWINPYAEGATNTNRFYLETTAIYTTMRAGQFGAPVVTYANPGVATNGHKISENGYDNELRLEGLWKDSGDHAYSLAAAPYDASGGLVLYDQTAVGSPRVFSYNPTGTALTLPNANATTYAGTAITPTALAADANNYTPTAGTVYRLEATGATRSITGWVAGRSGQEIEIQNVGATQNIALIHASASSSAANRFALPDALDLIVKPGHSVRARYDATSAVWRVVGTSAAASVANAAIVNSANSFTAANTFTGPVTIGSSGLAVSAIRHGSRTLNVSAIPGNNLMYETYTLVGAVLSDKIHIVGPEVGLPPGLVLNQVWVSATDQITICWDNVTSSTIPAQTIPVQYSIIR